MLKTRNDLARARADFQAALGAQTRKILVCAGTGCVAGGALDLYEELKRLIDEAGSR